MPDDVIPVYGAVEIGGEQHQVVLDGGGGGQGSESPHGLTLDVDRFNTSAELEVSVLADPPASGTDVSCSLQGETVFTGTVTKAEGRSGWVHVVANDVAHELKRASLTQSFQQAPIEDIATAALEEVDADNAIDLPLERTSAEFSDERCDRILEQCATWGNGVWWVDTQNTVHLTQDIAAASTQHEAAHVIDAAPGERSMPYQSVKVIGASPASSKGVGSMHLISSESVTATAGTGEPTYEHEDDRIKTQAMANNAAQKILDELRRQRAGGPVTIVGEPALTTFDTLTLPPAISTQEYLVSGIQHRVTSQDGFRTTVQCSGAVDGGTA